MFILLSAANSFCHNEKYVRLDDKVIGIGKRNSSRPTGRKDAIGYRSKGGVKSTNVKFNMVSNEEFGLNKISLGKKYFKETFPSHKSTTLSSSIAEIPESIPSQRTVNMIKRKIIVSSQGIEWQDLAVVTSYMCNTLALGMLLIGIILYAEGF